MKNIKFGLFALLLFIISCDPADQTTDLLRLDINEEGLVDVFDTEKNTLILTNLNVSYNDDNDSQVLLLESGDRFVSTSFSDKMGTGTEHVLEKQLTDQNLNFRWTLRTFTDKAVVTVKMGLSGVSDSVVRINRLTPVFASEKGGIVSQTENTLRFLELEPETWAYKNMRVLEDSGTGRFVTGIANQEGAGTIIGCISFNRFRGIFEMNDNRGASGVININAFNDIDDHMMLDPGENLESEWFYIDCTEDIFNGLEEWARLAGNLNNAVVCDPPATGFYTWYYYRDYVSEEIMIENTDFLAENRDRFPVNFIHIDWGWQRNYSSGDTVPNEKFPRGLGYVAQYIRDHDFHPSLWVNPFMYTTPTAEAPSKHPDIFLTKSDDEMVEHEPIRNIMANVWGDAEYMISEGVTNTLDVTDPDAHDFLKKRYEWVSDMGYDMAMMDFIIYGRTSQERGDQLTDPDMSTYEGIRKALMAAREGLGEGKNVLGCGTIYEPTVGTSNLTRISLDATANWPSVKMASKDLILQYFMNYNLWTNYADGIFVRDKASPYWGEYELDEEGNKIAMFVTEDEAEFYTAVTGLTQAAVMYTEDIQRLAPERQWLLSILMPIYREGKFRPVDLFRSIPAKTLQLECSQGNREWIVAAGLNWTEEIDNTGLDLNLLNLDESKKYHAFNVFEQEYMGSVSSAELLGPVNAHGVLLVNLVEDLNRPQVVGTDLHISQGGVEIGDEQWDENSSELILQVNDLYGRKGNLYVYIPGTYSYTSENDDEIKPFENGNLLKLQVILDGKKEIKLVFEK